MPSLRETKNRIRSVKNTEKITRAMKMVAASKLRRAQEAVLKPRSFAKKLESIIGLIALKLEADSDLIHPLLEDRKAKERVEVLSLSSDRGLCGALNSNVVRTTQRFILDNEEKYQSIILSSIGKKGFEGLLRAGLDLRKHYQPDGKVFSFDMAKVIALELCDRFVNKEIDAVYLVYNEFKSAITQNVVIEQLLPVVRTPTHDKESTINFIYEPNKEELLEMLIPKHFATKLYQAFLESYASEQGARMTAMDNATRNAKEMTERLTLLYNRARQASITKELMEIIGGAEAL